MTGVKINDIKKCIKIIFRYLVLKLILLLLPIFIIFIVFKRFGVSSEVLASSLTGLVLMYLTLAYVENALRQTEIYKSQYQPSLSIRVKDITEEISIDNGDVDKKSICISSLGNNPIYDVLIYVETWSDVKNQTPIPQYFIKLIRRRIKHKFPKKTLPVLFPNSEEQIVTLSSKDLGYLMGIYVSYVDILGERRDVVFQKGESQQEFFLIKPPIDIRRGILLTLIEDFRKLPKIYSVLSTIITLVLILFFIYSLI